MRGGVLGLDHTHRLREAAGTSRQVLHELQPEGEKVRTRAGRERMSILYTTLRAGLTHWEEYLN